jgi:hypothetical protein
MRKTSTLTTSSVKSKASPPSSSVTPSPAQNERTTVYIQRCSRGRDSRTWIGSKHRYRLAKTVVVVKGRCWCALMWQLEDWIYPMYRMYSITNAPSMQRYTFTDVVELRESVEAVSVWPYSQQKMKRTLRLLGKF